MTLLHRRHPAPPPPTGACPSHALYWVVTPAGVQRATCGPHLERTLSLLRAEGGQTAEAQPAAGTACDWQEAA